MFEKFSNLDIDSAGRGGEYTVQVRTSEMWLFCVFTDVIRKAGFGWTNGVALWIASNYGKVAVAPLCPNLLEVSGSSQTSGGDGGPQTGGGKTGGAVHAWKTVPDVASLAVVGVLVLVC
jgi:alpha,alpha-trehalase